MAAHPVEFSSGNSGPLQEIPGEDEPQLLDLVDAPAKFPFLPLVDKGLHLVEVSPNPGSLTTIPIIGPSPSFPLPLFKFGLLPLFSL